MSMVKPPYKFKNPYWTHDPAGKQHEKYRFGILSFGSNGGFKEISNSESSYYEDCTLDLSIYKTTKMKEKIKQLRVEIDGLAQLCEGLKPITRYVGEVDPYKDDTIPSVLAFPNENSQEIKEAIKSLKLSKAWLGKVLEGLGSESPYKSGYKTAEDIEPEADKATLVCGTTHPELTGVPVMNNSLDGFKLGVSVPANYTNMSHIEKVDWLRTEIKRIGVQLYNTIYFKEIGISEGELAYKYICEARFWLGFELGRIKNYSNE